MDDKVTGPRSSFSSIEKKDDQPIGHWMKEFDAVKGKQHMEQVEWLKATHGMGHGHANALVGVYREEHVG